MTTEQYYVNNRPYTALSALSSELVYDHDKNYLYDLSYLGVINMVGDKSREFLQGQLSCDMRDVNSQQMRPGAMCNLKGRILALLDVIDWHGIQLILPNDLCTETQASLTKTALFSKVQLNASTSYRLFGFYLQNRDDIIPFSMNLPKERFSVIYEDKYYCYSLGNGYYMLLIKPEDATAITTLFSQRLQYRGSLAWRVLQLQQLHLEIYPESRGLFLPHRLGLQNSGYLSFNKGCYKGQEIIARTHYRAKLKHTIKVFNAQSPEPIQSGKQLFSKDSMVETGEIVDYCPTGDGQYLIAASVLSVLPQDP